MFKNLAKYDPKLDFKSIINVDEFVNKKTISRYLYDGSYARPGSDHFLKGFSYPNIEKFDIDRKNISTILDIENRIRENVRSILLHEDRISLLLTSGLDSYLIYLGLNL